MRKLKYVIIGAGANVLNMHRSGLALEHVNVVGVQDNDATRGKLTAQDFNCQHYADYHTMLADCRPDVAVILTPHPTHPHITLDCLKAGCHVLLEKPMAVQVADADAMIALATAQNRHLCVTFQRRYKSPIETIKRLITEGELGEIQYAALSIVWTRPALYFTERTWRGTWAGEGGGIIINQAAHQLDMLCYLLGLPERVYAWTQRQIHDISTEDTAQAMVAWENGATGFIHATTAQVGAPDRFEIRGTRGVVELVDDDLTFFQLETDLREYAATSTDLYTPPTGEYRKVTLAPDLSTHTAIYRNLNAAILDGEPLRYDGSSARLSLELANAVLLSGHVREEVSLPLNRERYRDFLNARIAEENQQ